MDLKLFGRQFLSPVATDLFDLEYLWFKYLNSAYSNIKGVFNCCSCYFVRIKHFIEIILLRAPLLVLGIIMKSIFFPLKYLFRYFIVLSYWKKYKYLSRTKYRFRISKVKFRVRKYTTLYQIKDLDEKEKSRKEKSTSRA